MAYAVWLAVRGFKHRPSGFRGAVILALVIDVEDWERELEEQLRRDRLRQQALQVASPELRADIERHERELSEVRKATARKTTAESARKRWEQNVGMAVGVLLGIVLSLAFAYAVIKFIKWAWRN